VGFRGKEREDRPASTRFELRGYREPALEPGMTFPGTEETVIGVYDDELEAIAVGRAAWKAFRESGSHDVAWWIVRAEGEQLARWIADSASPKERVLDLRTNTLVEVD